MVKRPRIARTASQPEVLLYAEHIRKQGRARWAELADYIEGGGLHAAFLTQTLTDFTRDAWTKTFASLQHANRNVVVLDKLCSPPTALMYVTEALRSAATPAGFLNATLGAVAGAMCVVCHYRAEQNIRSLFRPWQMTKVIQQWYETTPALARSLGEWAGVAMHCMHCWTPCQSCGQYPHTTYSPVDLAARTNGLCEKCTPLSLLAVTPPKFTPNKLREAARMFREKGF